MQVDVSIHFAENESAKVASLLHWLQSGESDVNTNPDSIFAVPFGSPSPLAQFLESPSFRAERDVLGRFKRVLSWLYLDNPEFFDTMVDEYVERTTGGRICLGRSQEEVNASGTNVKAQQIPSTPYWVETNSDTPKKKRHLHEWMIGLASTDADMEIAVAALGESQARLN